MTLWRTCFWFSAASSHVAAPAQLLLTSCSSATGLRLTFFCLVRKWRRKGGITALPQMALRRDEMLRLFNSIVCCLQWWQANAIFRLNGYDYKSYAFFLQTCYPSYLKQNIRVYLVWSVWSLLCRCCWCSCHHPASLPVLQMVQWWQSHRPPCTLPNLYSNLHCRVQQHHCLWKRGSMHIQYKYIQYVHVHTV